MSLDSLIESVPTVEPAKADIDLSAVLGQPDGTTVLTFIEPTAPQLFQANKDAAKVRAQFPEMPIELASIVALIAISHVAPAAETPRTILYAHLAMKNRNIFMHLSAEFSQAFPALQDMAAAVKTEKKS